MTPSQSKAYITGCGAVTCHGVGHTKLIDSLHTQNSALSLNSETNLCEGLLPFYEVKNQFEQLAQNGLFPDSFKKTTDQNMQAIGIALHESMEMAGWKNLEGRTGFIFATTTGTIPQWESSLVDFSTGACTARDFEQDFRNYSIGHYANLLTQAFGIHGPTQVITSACAAGLQSIVMAKAWIESGHVDRCLVGSLEVLSAITRSGFNCFKLLNQDPCRPFDNGSSHITLAEAAAFLCLEARPPASDGIRVMGGGMAQDHFDLTRPAPKGEGLQRSMRAALKDAEVEPDSIGWIHAHGTGTEANDLAECHGVQEVFGHRQPYMSSTKSLHGHCLAASGLVEVQICMEALGQQKIFPTYGLEHPYQEVGTNHPHGILPLEGGLILKNTLGFGGVNASLILGGS